jgi:Ca-activated chloride channel homolog
MKTSKEILIDNSGSMGSKLFGSKRKNELAKEILIEKIFPYISSADSVGIRIFGGSCGMVGHLENIPNANFKKLRDFVLHKIPTPSGSTPLALAITTAVDSLKLQHDAHKEIYLVTDGQETCGGNVKEAADYAARNDIKCVINIIAIGEINDEAREQFQYITKVTRGKNINIGTKDIDTKTIDRELSDLIHSDVERISDLIDDEFHGKKDSLAKRKTRSIRDFILHQNFSVNYIPSDFGAVCQRLLVIEFFDEDKDLENLISGLKHVQRCELKNKEVLILVNRWDEEFHSRFFKSWKNRFAQRGIEKFCIKLNGFKSYTEIK